jgi:hypothetical protein
MDDAQTYVLKMVKELLQGSVSRGDGAEWRGNDKGGNRRQEDRAHIEGACRRHREGIGSQPAAGCDLNGKLPERLTESDQARP